MLSVIKPKTPKSNGWIECGRSIVSDMYGYESVVWRHLESGLCVISAVEVASDENDFDRGPEYHVSVSKNGGRCSSNEAKFVLKEFGMLDSEEDSHVPNGVVRNYWLPVAEKLIGVECPCKKSESVVKESKGDYIWRPA